MQHGQVTPAQVSEEIEKLLGRKWAKRSWSQGKKIKEAGVKERREKQGDYCRLKGRRGKTLVQKGVKSEGKWGRGTKG